MLRVGRADERTNRGAADGVDWDLELLQCLDEAAVRQPPRAATAEDEPDAVASEEARQAPNVGPAPSRSIADTTGSSKRCLVDRRSLQSDASLTVDRCKATPPS